MDPAPCLRRCETPTGVRFGIWGPELTGPAPILIILANTITGTLEDPYYRQCGTTLAAEGWCCASIDLPCHGAEHRAGEPAELLGWRHRAEAGEDFVAETNRRLTQVLDHLIATRRVDGECVTACGTSRGGFLALHFAAHDERVKGVAAFAPVTDLLALREFRDAGANPLIQALALRQHAAILARRDLWLVIGDQDERVGTHHAVELADRIATVACEQGRPVAVEMHVLPEPRGHTTPTGAEERATAWLRGRF
ncbi:MAG: prolyl oligopeptidase family serine peptidase [Cephaloticoccus sp.]|nr:prolyl oligopeptidase family serine peptidase [Cephaloticoccus sp.]MCF7758910.1 prolyl oligopeptidase family serine peptidase [Cephaloticoccus sp.]